MLCTRRQLGGRPDWPWHESLRHPLAAWGSPEASPRRRNALSHKHACYREDGRDWRRRPYPKLWRPPCWNPRARRALPSV